MRSLPRRHLGSAYLLPTPSCRRRSRSRWARGIVSGLTVETDCARFPGYGSGDGAATITAQKPRRGRDVRSPNNTPPPGAGERCRADIPRFAAMNLPDLQTRAIRARGGDTRRDPQPPCARKHIAWMKGGGRLRGNRVTRDGEIGGSSSFTPSFSYHLSSTLDLTSSLLPLFSITEILLYARMQARRRRFDAEGVLVACATTELRVVETEDDRRRACALIRQRRLRTSPE